MAGAAITVRGLRKTYAARGDVVATPAVDGIDLTVERGEVFALLGPNGAGKTTTVEVLEGFRDRDGGEVEVLGGDPAHATPSWRARIGIVLQSAADVAELSVAETVHHFAGYYPAPRDPDEVIEAVGLTDKRDARGRQLSGGQRRRLDVALGIIGDPELLFLDEPTTGFDPEARRRFWSLISGLRAGGTTILLTTHYLDEAEALADRLAVIAGGRILETATPATLGGRAHGEVRVAWTDADGRARTEQTTAPTQVVTELAARFGGEVPDLTVVRPSLEDVYLRMISAERDAPAEPTLGAAGQDLRSATGARR